MSQAIPFKLTVAGQDAAFNLGAIDLNVTHVQLGSGNRLANGNEVALVTPQETATITGYFEVAVGQHRIAAVIPGSASAYQVSEIGLWSGVPGAGGSVLVFYWSLATGYIAHKDAGIDFNFEDDILFGGVVPGNITIVADTEFNALAMLAAHEADPNAHPIIATPPLGDNDQSPVNSEWVQQTIGAVLSKSVAGSEDVTLTAVEAGHGILKLTGVLTGDIDVIVPDSPTREWLVINSTTGNYALTVKTAAGTGVVVAQSADTPIYTDGTDVLYGMSVIPQAEAVEGVATTSRGWSAERVRQSATAVVGVGQIAYFAMSAAPTGYLKANGALYSRTAYAALFAAIGIEFGAGDGSTTFAVPDLRGEFIRGWDDGRGIDAARTFGSAQADDFESHAHASGQLYVGGSSGNAFGQGYTNGTPGGINVPTGAVGGTETRPRNMALLACIKY